MRACITADASLGARQIRARSRGVATVVPRRIARTGRACWRRRKAHLTAPSDRRARQSVVKNARSDASAAAPRSCRFCAAESGARAVRTVRGFALRAIPRLPVLSADLEFHALRSSAAQAPGIERSPALGERSQSEQQPPLSERVDCHPAMTGSSGSREATAASCWRGRDRPRDSDRTRRRCVPLRLTHARSINE